MPGQDGLRWSLSLSVHTYDPMRSSTDISKAFFNAMLKDLGIQGVKVQEIWDLDSDQLAILP